MIVHTISSHNNNTIFQSHKNNKLYDNTIRSNKVDTKKIVDTIFQESEENYQKIKIKNQMMQQELNDRWGIVLDLDEIVKAANQAFKHIMEEKKEVPLDMNRIKKVTGLSNAELYADFSVHQNITNSELKEFEKDYNKLDTDTRRKYIFDAIRRNQNKSQIPHIMKDDPKTFKEIFLSSLRNIKQNVQNLNKILLHKLR